MESHLQSSHLTNYFSFTFFSKVKPNVLSAFLLFFLEKINLLLRSKAAVLSLVLEEVDVVHIHSILTG
jgi:hypothetical protein